MAPVAALYDIHGNLAALEAVLDEAKVRGWLEKGAQPTESVAKLLKAQGIQ